jgi:hypothetical protein
MGLFAMSRSTYEPVTRVVGRISFAPEFESASEREVRRQRDRVFERVNDHQVAVLPNPNPLRFEVRSVEAIGRGLVVEVVYPDCTTYEGRKVLVFAGVTEAQARAATVLDPHFTDKAPEGALVPVARFEPTARGWKLARICAVAL